MPKCQNCGGHVTKRYVRVRSVDGKTVGACPQCEHMTRDADGRPRPARDGSGATRGSNSHGDYQPDWGDRQ